MRSANSCSAVCGGGPIARSFLTALRLPRALRLVERELVRGRLARRRIAELPAAHIGRNLSGKRAA